MIKKYMPSYWAEYKIYAVIFDDFDNHGHMFPCDKDGILKEMSRTKRSDYEFCMSNPHLFPRFNKVVEYDIPYKIGEKGVCECGYTVSLDKAGMYGGTCECPKCKRVYDIHGVEYSKPKKSYFPELKSVCGN